MALLLGDYFFASTHDLPTNLCGTTTPQIIALCAHLATKLSRRGVLLFSFSLGAVRRRYYDVCNKGPNHRGKVGHAADLHYT
jgi:hypothetical protein